MTRLQRATAGTALPTVPIADELEELVGEEISPRVLEGDTHPSIDMFPPGRLWPASAIGFVESVDYRRITRVRLQITPADGLRV